MGIFDLFQNKPAKTIEMDELHYSKMNKETFISEYFIPRKPLLIKEGAKNWPIVDLWTKEYVNKKFGHYMCTVVKDSRPAMARESTTLKNFFKNHKGQSTLTLESNPMKVSFILKGLKLPNLFFSRKDINRFFFYFSVKNAGTLPHYHKDAFNILREGKKRWVMFDANEQSAPKGYNTQLKGYKKYPKGTHAKDWFVIDLPKTTRKLPVFECYQEASDIVYVPWQFSHAVLNISEEVLGLVVETNR